VAAAKAMLDCSAAFDKLLLSTARRNKTRETRSGNVATASVSEQAGMILQALEEVQSNRAPVRCSGTAARLTGA